MIKKQIRSFYITSTLWVPSPPYMVIDFLLVNGMRCSKKRGPVCCIVGHPSDGPIKTSMMQHLVDNMDLEKISTFLTLYGIERTIVRFLFQFYLWPSYLSYKNKLYLNIEL